MQFATLEFSLFFIFVFAITWLLKSKFSLQKAFLIGASFFFYGCFNSIFVPFLLSAAFINFIGGVMMNRHPVRTKGLLIFFVSLNVAFLGYFKYYNFFVDNANYLLLFTGVEFQVPFKELLFPLGISFFTFQNIAYLVDIHQKKTRPCLSLLDFLLYSSFFPKLISGPIVRPREFIEQLEESRNHEIDISYAVTWLVSGLFKKVFIATYLGMYFVDDAFQSPENYSSLELLIASYGYSIQIFCDFSGYTDIAMGLSLLLGYRIPDNFNSPYSAVNIGDYWRRWHITFSTWLRDYLYFPLGGSRKGYLRTYINLFITFAICGIWHGADYKYVLWGVIHALLLIGYKIFIDIKRAIGFKDREKKHILVIISGWFLTFHLCVFSRIPFYSPDLESAAEYWRQLTALTPNHDIFPWAAVTLISLGLIINFWGRRIAEFFVSIHTRLHWIFRIFIWSAFAIAIIFLHPGELAPFIYFRF